MNRFNRPLFDRFLPSGRESRSYKLSISLPHSIPPYSPTYSARLRTFHNQPVRGQIQYCALLSPELDQTDQLLSLPLPLPTEPGRKGERRASVCPVLRDLTKRLKLKKKCAMYSTFSRIILDKHTKKPSREKKKKGPVTRCFFVGPQHRPTSEAGKAGARE